MFQSVDVSTVKINFNNLPGDTVIKTQSHSRGTCHSRLRVSRDSEEEERKKRIKFFSLVLCISWNIKMEKIPLLLGTRDNR